MCLEDKLELLNSGKCSTNLLYTKKADDDCSSSSRATLTSRRSDVPHSDADGARIMTNRDQEDGVYDQKSSAAHDIHLYMASNRDPTPRTLF